jgi:hypothetical protein
MRSHTIGLFGLAITCLIGIRSAGANSMSQAPVVVVADPGQNLVNQVSATGVVTPYATGLDFPFGVAFDPNGNLFVGNLQGNTISKVSPSGVVTPFVTSGVQYPIALTFDHNGNLYVANETANTVSKITPAGSVST